MLYGTHVELYIRIVQLDLESDLQRKFHTLSDLIIWLDASTIKRKPLYPIPTIALLGYLQPKQNWFSPDFISNNVPFQKRVTLIVCTPSPTEYK